MDTLRKYFTADQWANLELLDPSIGQVFDQGYGAPPQPGLFSTFAPEPQGTAAMGLGQYAPPAPRPETPPGYGQAAQEPSGLPPIKPSNEYSVASFPIRSSAQRGGLPSIDLLQQGLDKAKTDEDARNAFKDYSFLSSSPEERAAQVPNVGHIALEQTNLSGKQVAGLQQQLYNDPAALRAYRAQEAINQPKPPDAWTDIIQQAQDRNRDLGTARQSAWGLVNPFERIRADLDYSQAQYWANPEHAQELAKLTSDETAGKLEQTGGILSQLYSMLPGAQGTVGSADVPANYRQVVSDQLDQTNPGLRPDQKELYIKSRYMVESANKFKQDDAALNEQRGLVPRAIGFTAKNIPYQAQFLAANVAAGLTGAAAGAAAGTPFGGVGAIPGALVGGALGTIAAYTAGKANPTYQRLRTDQVGVDEMGNVSQTQEASGVGEALAKTGVGLGLEAGIETSLGKVAEYIPGMSRLRVFRDDAALALKNAVARTPIGATAAELASPDILKLLTPLKQVRLMTSFGTIPEEVAEEYVDAAKSSLLNTDNEYKTWGLGNVPGAMSALVQQTPDMILSFALMGGAQRGPAKLMQVRSNQLRSKMNASDLALDDWQTEQSVLKAFQWEDLPSSMRGVLSQVATKAQNPAQAEAANIMQRDEWGKKYYDQYRLDRLSSLESFVLQNEDKLKTAMQRTENDPLQAAYLLAENWNQDNSELSEYPFLSMQMAQPQSTANAKPTAEDKMAVAVRMALNQAPVAVGSQAQDDAALTPFKRENDNPLMLDASYGKAILNAKPSDQDSPLVQRARGLFAALTDDQVRTAFQPAQTQATAVTPPMDPNAAPQVTPQEQSAAAVQGVPQEQPAPAVQGVPQEQPAPAVPQEQQMPAVQGAPQEQPAPAVADPNQGDLPGMNAQIGALPERDVAADAAMPEAPAPDAAVAAPVTVEQSPNVPAAEPAPAQSPAPAVVAVQQAQVDADALINQVANQTTSGQAQMDLLENSPMAPAESAAAPIMPESAPVEVPIVEPVPPVKASVEPAPTPAPKKSATAADTAETPPAVPEDDDYLFAAGPSATPAREIKTKSELKKQYEDAKLEYLTSIDNEDDPLAQEPQTQQAALAHYQQAAMAYADPSGDKDLVQLKKKWNAEGIAQEPNYLYKPIAASTPAPAAQTGKRPWQKTKTAQAAPVSEPTPAAPKSPKNKKQQAAVQQALPNTEPQETEQPESTPAPVAPEPEQEPSLDFLTRLQQAHDTAAPPSLLKMHRTIAKLAAMTGVGKKVKIVDALYDKAGNMKDGLYGNTAFVKDAAGTLSPLADTDSDTIVVSRRGMYAWEQANKLPAALRISQVLAHEQTHRGSYSAMLGPEYKSLLKSMVKHQMPHIRRTIDDAYKNADDEVAVQEFLSKVAEIAVSGAQLKGMNGTLWRKARVFVKKKLAQWGVDMPLSAHDVNYIAREMVTTALKEGTKERSPEEHLAALQNRRAIRKELKTIGTPDLAARVLRPAEFKQHDETLRTLTTQRKDTNKAYQDLERQYHTVMDKIDAAKEQPQGIQPTELQDWFKQRDELKALLGEEKSDHAKADAAYKQVYLSALRAKGVPEKHRNEMKLGNRAFPKMAEGHLTPVEFGMTKHLAKLDRTGKEDRLIEKAVRAMKARMPKKDGATKYVKDYKGTKQTPALTRALWEGWQAQPPQITQDGDTTMIRIAVPYFARKGRSLVQSVKESGFMSILLSPDLVTREVQEGGKVTAVEEPAGTWNVSFATQFQGTQVEDMFKGIPSRGKALEVAIRQIVLHSVRAPREEEQVQTLEDEIAEQFRTSSPSAYESTIKRKSQDIAASTKQKESNDFASALQHSLVALLQRMAHELYRPPASLSEKELESIDQQLNEFTAEQENHGALPKVIPFNGTELSGLLRAQITPIDKKKLLFAGRNHVQQKGTTPEGLPISRNQQAIFVDMDKVKEVVPEILPTDTAPHGGVLEYLQDNARDEAYETAQDEYKDKIEQFKKKTYTTALEQDKTLSNSEARVQENATALIALRRNTVGQRESLEDSIQALQKEFEDFPSMEFFQPYLEQLEDTKVGTAQQLKALQDLDALFAAAAQQPEMTDQWTDATGDVVKGDIIQFEEGVFGGSFRKPQHLGSRTITARILNDSYGADKQQHTFTLKGIAAEGTQAKEVLDTQAKRGYITRKGRNVYRNGTQRQVWADESARNAATDEKHSRGSEARTLRDLRRESENQTLFATTPTELETKVMDHFGTTSDPREAGYMLQNGTMLDFSGRHDAVGYKNNKPKSGEKDWFRGERNIDHRDLPEGITMTDMLRSGAVRMDATAGLIDIEQETTAQQTAKLSEVMGHREFVIVEATNAKGQRFSSEILSPSSVKVRAALRKANEFLSGLRDPGAQTLYAASHTVENSDQQQDQALLLHNQLIRAFTRTAHLKTRQADSNPLSTRLVNLKETAIPKILEKLEQLGLTNSRFANILRSPGHMLTYASDYLTQRLNQIDPTQYDLSRADINTLTGLVKKGGVYTGSAETQKQILQMFKQEGLDNTALYHAIKGNESYAPVNHVLLLQQNLDRGVSSVLKSFADDLLVQERLAQNYKGRGYVKVEKQAREHIKEANKEAQNTLETTKSPIPARTVLEEEINKKINLPLNRPPVESLREIRALVKAALKATNWNFSDAQGLLPWYLRELTRSAGSYVNQDPITRNFMEELAYWLHRAVPEAHKPLQMEFAIPGMEFIKRKRKKRPLPLPIQSLPYTPSPTGTNRDFIGFTRSDTDKQHVLRWAPNNDISIDLASQEDLPITPEQLDEFRNEQMDLPPAAPRTASLKEASELSKADRIKAIAQKRGAGEEVPDTLFAASNLSPENVLDAAYRQTLQSSGLAAVQKLVDIRAKEAGYTIGPVWHGSTEKNLTVLSPTKAVETQGVVFFSDNEAVSYIFRFPREYGEVITDYYDPETEDMIEIEPGMLLRGYLRLQNPLILTGQEAQRATDDTTYQSEIIGKAKKQGHDGVIFQQVQEGVGDWTEPGTTYGIFTANQVKSADPVTYNSKGEIIPLSERFNLDKNNVLFAASNLSPTEDPDHPMAEYFRQMDTEHAEQEEAYSQKVFDRPFEPHLYPKLTKEPLNLEALRKARESSAWAIPRLYASPSLDLADDVADQIHRQEMDAAKVLLTLKVLPEALKGLFLSDYARKRQDLNPLIRFLALPSHSSKATVGGRKVWKAGRDHDINRNIIHNDLIRWTDDKGKKTNEWDVLAEYYKQKKPQYEKLNHYLFTKDAEAIAPAVVEEADTAFIAYDQWNPQTRKELFRIEIPAKTTSTEKLQIERNIWDRIYKQEASAYSKDEKDQQALLAARRLLHRDFEALQQVAQRAIDYAQKNNKPEPTVDWESENGVVKKITLTEALQKMGDRRGYYMPRIRKEGHYKLIASKPGELGYLEIDETKLGAEIQAARLKREGYTVQRVWSTALDERENLSGISPYKIGLLVTELFDRMEDRNQFTVTLKNDTLTVSGKFVNTLKEYLESRNFVLDRDSQEYRYSSPGNTTNLESIKQAIENHIATQTSDASHIAGLQNLAMEQLTQLLETYGGTSMKRRLARKEGSPTLGYDMRASEVINQAIMSSANGLARQQMVTEMLNAMSGFTIPWETYRDQALEKDPAAKHADLWKAYRDDMRRLSLQGQPVAKKESMDFMEEMLRPTSKSEVVFGWLRWIAAIKYLSSPSTGVINMTSLATTVPASLSTNLGVKPLQMSGLILRGLTAYSQAWADKLKDPELQEFYSEIQRRGLDISLQNQEATQITDLKGRHSFQKWLEYSMFFMRQTERLVRGATLMAAYIHQRDMTKKHGVPLDKQEALKLAETTMDDAHGVYGKANRLVVGRGKEAPAQIINTAMLFQTFTINYMNLIGRAINPKNRDLKAAAYLLAMPIIIGGAGAGAGAPILEAIAKCLGLSYTQMMEDFYAWFGQAVGGPTKTNQRSAETLARYGALGALNISGKGSMQIKLPTSTTNIVDWGGPAVSMLKDELNGLHSVWDIYAQTGELPKGTAAARAAELILPRLGANVVRAYRESQEGVVRNQLGKKVLVYGDSDRKEPVPIKPLDVAQATLGFRTAQTAMPKDKNFALQTIKSELESKRQDIYKTVRILNTPEYKKNLKAQTALRTRIKEYNEYLRQHKLLGKVSPITTDALRRVRAE